MPFGNLFNYPHFLHETLILNTRMKDKTSRNNPETSVTQESHDSLQGSFSHRKPVNKTTGKWRLESSQVQTDCWAGKSDYNLFMSCGI